MAKKAIVIVDDDIGVLRSLKEQLRNNFGNEYDYETVDNAAEGMKIIDELVKDGLQLILIVDWLMPGMKGDQMLIEVHKKYPEIIKIMLTGHATRDSINNALLNANLFACIYKPWEEKTLVQVINTFDPKMPPIDSEIP